MPLLKTIRKSLSANGRMTKPFCAFFKLWVRADMENLLLDSIIVANMKSAKRTRPATGVRLAFFFAQ